MERYWLDSNVFINAAASHYAMRFCPAFWDWIVQSHADGLLASVARVKEEITVVEDELKTWVLNLDQSFFVPPDEHTIGAYSEVSSWVNNRDCFQRAKDQFLSKADPHLIAQAKAHGGIVVTHEVPAPDAKKAIKIPDVCDAMGVGWISPFRLLQREHPNFILDS